MKTLQSLLNDPLTIQLLSTHPNTYAVESTSFRIPRVDGWLDLIKFYATGRADDAQCSSSKIPSDILQLIASVRQLQLPREPISMTSTLKLRSEQGMSPKKSHEVSRMATYIVELVSRLPSSSKGLRIVDIGAGQGYLTRALKTYLPDSHILALDADIEQTKGAQKWEKRLLPKEAQEPAIDHKVVFISRDTLLSAVDEWVGSHTTAEEGQVPVLFVALHACGSLTPDILRAFAHAANGKGPERRDWYPAGLVVVGCCYNLMTPSDYPPSTKHLPLSAYHLAAQIPSQWLNHPEASPNRPILDPSVALSIRKVTWRALLSKALETASRHPGGSQQPHSQSTSATVPARWSRRPQPGPETDASQYEAPESGTGFTPTMNRLGKLRDSVYMSWNTFLRAAEERLGVIFDESEFDDEDEDEDNFHSNSDHTVDSAGRDVTDNRGPTKGRPRGRDTQLEKELAGLHVLRCLLGSAIESAILLDRIGWIQKELDIGKDGKGNSQKIEGGLNFQAELVNLFDQSTGSGRNVAIVVVPRDS